MTNELTLTAALASAVVALAGCVGVLWRTSEKRHEALEKRTESHLNVATEQMKVLALIEVQMRGFTPAIERLSASLTTQLEALEKRIEGRNESEVLGHGAQMKVLATIEATLLQRKVEPVVRREATSG